MSPSHVSSLVQRRVRLAVAAALISFSSLATQAAPVEFTLAEGYLNGALSNQPSPNIQWKTVSGGLSFYVDSSDAGQLMVLTNQSATQYGVWQTPANFSQDAGNTYYIDFNFEQSPTATTATLIGLTYFTNAISGNSNVRAFFGRNTATDQYRIGFYQNNGSPATSSAWNIAGSVLGINSGSGDNLSDQLRLSYTLTRGATASEWSAKVTLKNLTTNTIVGTINIPSFTSSAAFHSDTSLYPALNSETIQNGSLTAFNITAFGPPTSDTPAGPPGTTLAFNDEFNTTSLDTNKWAPHYCKPATINSELQAYLPDNFEFSGTTLRIRSDNRVFSGKNYTSGAITSFGRFSQTYGYYEMRAKVPEGRGFWPAFWLLPQSQAWPPEIDIMEILTQDPRVIHQTLHFNNPALSTPANPLGKTANGKAFTGPDFSQDYHTFAVSWRPEALIFYVDGVERHRITSFVPNTPMYILANTAVGGNWPVSPDLSTLFPAYFDIDYIRAYSYDDLPATTPLPLSYGKTTIMPEAVAPGGTITVTSSVEVGNADVARVSIHMLIKNFWGTTQYSDTYQFQNNLVHNTSRPFTFTYTVPSNLPEGLYTVGFTLTDTATSTNTALGLAARFKVGNPLTPYTPPPAVPPQPAINLAALTFSNVPGQGIATQTLTDGGYGLRVQGNGWKVADHNYTITANTWLEFDVSAASIGESYSIGFLPTAAYDNTTLNTYCFQIYGGQPLGRQHYNTYSVVSGGVKHYRVPIGKFYTGAVTKLLFVNDMDAAPTGDVTFSNVKLYELP